MKIMRDAVYSRARAETGADFPDSLNSSRPWDPRPTEVYLQTSEYTGFGGTQRRLTTSVAYRHLNPPKHSDRVQAPFWINLSQVFSEDISDKSSLSEGAIRELIGYKIKSLNQMSISIK